jgi:hypothetical protein
MVTNMMAEYQLPADHILRIWKESGDLQKATTTLKQLKESSGETSSRIVMPNSTLPAHNSPVGREDAGRTAASNTTLPVHNAPLADADTVVHANDVSNVVTRDATSPPRAQEPQIGRVGSSTTDGDTSSTTSTSFTSFTSITSSTPDHPPSPNRNSSQNPLDADANHPHSEAQTAQIPMPLDLQKVYTLLSSPGRKDVLQRFWARYGRDFLQVEHTLKSWNPTTTTVT